MSLLLLASRAEALPFLSKRKAPEPEPFEAVEAIPPMPSPFAEALPRAHGGVPEGLHGASAQACNACHAGTHEAWASSAHATGWRSEAFRAAVADVGSPLCTTCHLPLRDQQAQVWAFDAGRLDRPVTRPNPTWDATLASEGVGCAACHVVGGVVVGARPPGPEVQSPHALGWTADLGRSEACASCHQLTWPGADRPFYDTWGEWERSSWAQAGVQCQDCHMGPGAAERSLGSDHGFAMAPGRGLTVQWRLPSPVLVRGAPPVEAAVELVNTGAGHAWPTGSPFRGVRLEVVLHGPDAARVVLAEGALERRIAEEPPWHTVDDGRLAPGAGRSVPLALALPTDAPAGDWELALELTRTVRGQPEGAPAIVRSVPLEVR